MRAIQVTKLGQAPQICDIPVPNPGPGEVLLRNLAVGLNFADTLMVAGTYQEKPALPFTLGMEICGVIEVLGEGVTGVTVGQRVAIAGGSGGLADFGCFPAHKCVPVPDGMSSTDAAAFLIAYGTSHMALDYKARLRPGERLLVLGASGGVGLTAVELGHLMGAEVIACARGAEKLALARAAGADHVIDSASEDIRARVKSLGGADVVYDPVGGDQFTHALRACNPEARLLPIGFASGTVPQIPANILLVKNLTVIGFYWGAYARFKPQVLNDSIAQLFRWHAEGRLKPHVSHILPLEETVHGLDLLRNRASTGKVIITL